MNKNTTAPTGVVSSTKLGDWLGPNALTYARERVSLLGAAEHMDTVNRALDALEGLPGSALLGGWTFKGFTAWAQGLENEIARLTAALKRANEQTEHFEREWYLRGDQIEAALPAMREYARKNPKHHFSADGAEQDPNGAHAWLERNDKPNTELKDGQ